MIIERHSHGFWYRLKYFFLLTGICSLSNAWGQANETELIASLEKYPQTVHDSIYYELFKVHRLSDREKAKHYAHRSLKLSSTYGHHLILAKSCNAIAYLCEAANNKDSAALYYQKGIKTSLANNFTERLIYFYNSLGLLYDGLDVYDSALHYFTLSFDLASRIHSFHDQAIAQHNMGLIYSHLEKYDEAVAYFKEAINIKKEHGISDGLNLNVLNLVNTYNEQGHYDTAIVKLEEIQKNCHADCNDNILACLNYGLGFAKFRKGMNTESFPYFLRSVEFSARSNNAQTLAYSLFHISLFKVDSGAYPEAINTLRQAEEIATHIKLRRLKRDIYDELSRIYDKMGAREQAAQYRKSFTLIRDSIYNHIVDGNLKVIEITSKFKESQNVIQQKNAELKWLHVISILIGVICILAFIVIRLVYKSLKTSRNLKRGLENEFIRRTFQLEETNREVFRLQSEFHYIIFRTSQYIKAPMATIKGLINIAQSSQTEKEMRECLDKMQYASKNFNVIHDLLDEFYDLRDQEIAPEKINVNSLADDLYQSFKQNGNLQLVALTVDKSVRKKLKTDKKLLINLITSSISYFNTQNSKSINVSFTQDDASTLINIEDSSIHTSSMIQENMFNLFRAQVAAFKLKGHILLAEKNNQTTLRIVIPNNIFRTSESFPLQGKQLVMQ